MNDIFFHGLLYFLASFAMYLLGMTNKQSNFALFLLLALPVLGVYFLGWWAVLTYIFGLFLGAKFYAKEVNRE